jgi:pimeloyl-ACP methyl ester carboxylesterase
MPRSAAVVCLAAALVGGGARAGAQERVSFATADGATIHADVYGESERAVVLAHGGRFNKESWAGQAKALQAAGFRVLALDFRGYGSSKGPGMADVLSAPLHLDVAAAVRYLRSTGAKTVFAVGGSMGGAAAAEATAAEPGSIERLVLLGSEGGRSPESLRIPKLFIVTRDDTSGSGPRLPGIQAHFDRAPEPKRMLILEGSAHAQFMFETPDAGRVMQEILTFLGPR